MRARIANLIVFGIFSICVTACQQKPEAEVLSVTPTPEAPAEKTEKKSPINKSPVSSVASSVSEQVAAPDPKSVAQEKAAAAKILPVKPGLRVSRVQVPGMYVALTFDDGPSSAYTPQVLDILKRHGAKGTFFVLGSNTRRCPSIVSRAAAEGHEIGVHTWSHINMVRSSVDKIDSEVSRTADVIRSVTGKSPAVMRPPYGAVNARIVNHMYDRYGMRSILWDVDTQDWRRPGVATVVNRAVNRAKPGSIILVHDIHASTLAAIEGIVTGLQARGFTLVTVSELLARAGATSAPKSPATPGAVEIAPGADADNNATKEEVAVEAGVASPEAEAASLPAGGEQGEIPAAETTVPTAPDSAQSDSGKTDSMELPAA
ncbi:MAG: polysaccharide deacetylase family protein [Akkermansia sp.]|nr:polysaccharide deacetylase family protein [Akkermansia sp.]